jgi:regulation of enolase protein 1 (concanavalin A-like superfamily)
MATIHIFMRLAGMHFPLMLHIKHQPHRSNTNTKLMSWKSEMKLNSTPILLSFLLVPLAMTCMSCRGPASHAKNSEPGIPGWGTVTDPDGDCNIRAENGTVSMTLPGDKVHTLGNFLATKNSPRILREVEGDFTVQVKVSGVFDPGTEAAAGVRARGRNSFNGAGLLVWDSDQNFVRLERNIWVTSSGNSYGYTPLLEYWKDNEIAIGFGGGPDTAGNVQCTYLRLSRQGDAIHVAYSRDGVEWTGRDPITVQLPKQVKVGVAAINSSKKPFEVEFSDFKLARR